MCGLLLGLGVRISHYQHSINLQEREELIIQSHPGPRERHLELLLHNTLRSIILVRMIPRTLVQITLQVRSLPEEEAAVGIDSVRLVSHIHIHPILLLTSSY